MEYITKIAIYDDVKSTYISGSDMFSSIFTTVSSSRNYSKLVVETTGDVNIWNFIGEKRQDLTKHVKMELLKNILDKYSSWKAENVRDESDAFKKWISQLRVKNKNGVADGTERFIWSKLSSGVADGSGGGFSTDRDAKEVVKILEVVEDKDEDEEHVVYVEVVEDESEEDESEEDEEDEDEDEDVEDESEEDEEDEDEDGVPEKKRRRIGYEEERHYIIQEKMYTQEEFLLLMIDMISSRCHTKKSVKLMRQINYKDY